eukprot:m.353081 g.353081  ORF g.353081 m.353081 type:complete len:235 (-) comp16678_c0_seq1:253-957(-)
MASPSLRKLNAELRSFQKDPLDGALVSVVDDNLYQWNVAIFGPPDTIFSGGYFKIRMTFPDSYPFNPPKLKFTSPIWHPNVYEDGTICISILHAPGPDEMSGERPEERWNPTQTVRTILLSVISLLNEPNTSSPANVNASVAYRKWKNGETDAYKVRVQDDVQASKLLAEEDGVVIPTSTEEYVASHKKPEHAAEDACDLDDYMADSDFDEDAYDFESADDDDDDDDDDGDGED